MKGVGKRGEEWSWVEQNLGVDSVKQLEVGEISDDPNLITVQKHNFSCLFVGAMEIGLILELVGIGDARGQIRQ
jgi:hypothetical protein